MVDCNIPGGHRWGRGSSHFLVNYMFDSTQHVVLAAESLVSRLGHGSLVPLRMVLCDWHVDLMMTLPKLHRARGDAKL